MRGKGGQERVGQVTQTGETSRWKQTERGDGRTDKGGKVMQREGTEEREYIILKENLRNKENKE